MSKDGNPHTPRPLHEAFTQRLKERTPIHDQDARQNSSKEISVRLISQNWWRNVESEDVERRRRERIQERSYYEVVILLLLDMSRKRLDTIEQSVLEAGLPELHKMLDHLNGGLLGLGATPDPLENARLAIPETEKTFWDEEVGFQRERKEEIQQLGFISDDSPPPASSTHTPALPLKPRSPNRLSPPSNKASKGAPKGVLNARVQKWRSRSYNGSVGKQRKTRASELRKPSSQVREGEPGTGAYLESASGGGPTTTTLSEKNGSSARVTRGRAGTKTKSADKPRRSEGVRKSTRIRALQKKSPPARRG